MAEPDTKGKSRAIYDAPHLGHVPRSRNETHQRTRLHVLRGLGLLALIAFFLVSNYRCLFCEDVEPLSPDFRSHCKTLLDAPEGTYTGRIDRLAATLEDDTIWVAEPGTSAEYFFGGFPSRDWWLSERPLLLVVSSTAEVTILTAKFEQARAELVHLPKEIKNKVTFVPWLESQSPYEVLSDYLRNAKGGKMVLDGQVRSFIAAGIKAQGWEEAVEEQVDKVKEIRERKDEREIGLLRCANQMTLHAIRKTKAKMYIGISESRTHEILNEEMAKTGLIDGDGLVLFGEDAATPHGEGTDRRLKKEDLVLIDAGGKWGGYTADVTRTFALKDSKISPAHIEVWETVRQAQYAAYTALHRAPSRHFGQLDAAARNVITAFTNTTSDTEEEPDYSVFTTRLGHGVGLDGHESPYVNQGPQGEREVKSGHVFSLEPGVYIPRGMKVRGLSGVGVRLEDCFVVTETEGRLGGEWLTGPVRQWGEI